MPRNNKDFLSESGMSASNNLSPKQVNPLEKTAGFENPHGKWSFKVGDVVNMAASKGKLNTFNPQIFAPQLEGRLGESTEENRTRTNAVDMSHPIVVLKHPDGTHSLLDGTHRVQNALEKGMKSINAQIVTHKDMQPWQRRSND